MKVLIGNLTDGVLLVRMIQSLSFSMFDNDHTDTIELQQNDKEVLRGEEYIRLGDDLVVNDQTETKAKKRTILQENSGRKSLNKKRMSRVE